MEIGDKIRYIRKEKKITQKELARICGISNTYLSDIERMRTNPSIKTLKSIAKSLNTDVKNFLE